MTTEEVLDKIVERAWEKESNDPDSPFCIKNTQYLGGHGVTVLYVGRAAFILGYYVALEEALDTLATLDLVMSGKGLK